MYVPSSARPDLPSPEKPEGIIQRHPLVCYFVMAYGFTWLAWIPYVLSQDGLGLLPFHLTQLGTLPGAYLGPLLSGFLMTAATEGKPGVRRLRYRFIQWRVGWQWYLFALCGIPIIIVMGLTPLPGMEAAVHPDPLHLILFFPPLLLMEILTSGLAEEPGWRGFALPRLQQQFGPLLGSVLLGILWQCWHLPLYLTSWGNGAGWLDILEAIIGNIGLTIVITWVFNHARESLLITILMHATLDACGADAELNLFSAPWLLKYSNLGLLIGFGIVALVLVVVTRGRLGYQRTNSSSDTVPMRL
jgi:membrane protease YdiL (CAAX protease family)